MAAYDTEGFHFPGHDDPVPELTDEVERLRRERRYGSALDATLRHLRAHGQSSEAYRLALPLLYTGMRRTADPGIAEPVARRQYANPYFAPVATECSRCTRFWYSGHDIASQARLVVTNPIGLQCQVCRYTLCRNCFDPKRPSCPERGCRGELGTPVVPTGRPRGKPANEFTEKLEHVMILWRSTPTSQEEAEELLDLACTWQDRGGITVRSQVNQSDARDGEELERRMGLVLVSLYEREGMISENGLYRTRVLPIESPGRGRRLVFVTAAPETGPASRLSGPVEYLLFDDPDGAGEDAPAPKRRWFRRRR